MSVLVSVITCTLNSEKYLNDCIKSVEAQDYQDIEHIVVDGYSLDNTLHMADKYKSRNPNRNIKVIKSQPLGISNAMNMGIKHSSGDIIHILHSDDYYYDGSAISRAVKLFKKNKSSNWLIGNRVMLYRKKKIKIANNGMFKKYGGHLINMFNWIPHASTFVRKNIFDKYGLFNENLEYMMDYEYWLRIYGKEKPLIVDSDFAVFRRHRNSTSFGIKNLLPIAAEYPKMRLKVK